MTAWYAVQTRGAYESKVRDRLRDLAIIEFWPNYPVKSRWSDRTQTIATSLFPCYLFGQFELIEQWMPILALPGVIRILGSFAHPAPVPDCEIENVRRLMAAPELLMPCPFLSAGDLVEIERGPWAGVQGIAVKTREGGCRVVVSIKKIGCSCSVEVDAEWLKKIPKTRDGSCSNSASSHHPGSEP